MPRYNQLNPESEENTLKNELNKQISYYKTINPKDRSKLPKLKYNKYVAENI